MSTLSETILSMEQVSDKELMWSVIAAMFMADYGIVKKVNSDKTVDVTHIVKPVSISEEQLPPVVSEQVEVLFPSSAAYSVSYPIAVGDKVLLIGLKNFVDTVDGTEPKWLDRAFFHYSQETLKAIPLCLYKADAKATELIYANGKSVRKSVGQEIDATTAKMLLKGTGAELNATTGKAKVAASAGSLKTSLDALITALTTFAATCATSTTDPTLVAAAGALTTAVTTVKSGIALFMED